MGHPPAAAGVGGAANIRSVLNWLGGKAALYLLLVLALLVSVTVWPWVQREWFAPPQRMARAERLEALAEELSRDRDHAQSRLAGAEAAARSKTIDELTAARVEAEAARAEALRSRRQDAEKAHSLVAGDTDALLRDGRLELEIQYRDREIAGLAAMIGLLQQGEARTRDLAWLQSALPGASQACHAARARADALEQRWQVAATLGLYDRAGRTAAKQALDRACGRERWIREQIGLATAGQRQVAAARQTVKWANTQIGPVTGGLEAEIAKERAAAEGSWRAKAILWAERVHLGRVLLQAAIALALIIASPYLVRALCYFVLAPLAVRRPMIRVAGGAAGASIAPIARSSPSVGIRLEPGEELLVRQGYLQTTSVVGEKVTQWLLDWRHPITSVAAGLTFLTRVRGEGEATTISAVRDPFAEVAILSLPAGAALVLQPRALAAVAQPIGRKLRISTHWRIWSLNAWLTLQLRYLVFHGPARLVLRGGRGVRVEPVERGRVLAQEQLVGFSTDVAYAVSRNETFWPYFLGGEPLLRDRVTGSVGVVVLEEAPMAGGSSQGARRGLEGVVDAALKALGV